MSKNESGINNVRKNTINTQTLLKGISEIEKKYSNRERPGDNFNIKEITEFYLAKAQRNAKNAKRINIFFFASSANFAPLREIFSIF